jgi:hypothetical protein
MTRRDEIMSMTPDELRLAIAERLGFSAERDPKSYKGEEWYILAKGGLPYTHNSHLTEEKALKDTPNWPRSIEDAWELAEDMRHKGIHVHLLLAPNGEEVDITIENYRFKFEKMASDTAPLAICRAWLIAQEAE